MPRPAPPIGGLLLAELRRFTSRRLFRFVGAVAVGLVVTTSVIAFVQSSKDPRAGLADARRDVEACERFMREAPEAEGTCPTAEQLISQYDKRFVYVREMPDATRGVAVTLFVASFVLAASFVGADWGSGTITTLLTWEPRRGRVLAAKVTVAVAMLALAGALLLALVAVVFFPVAVFRGTTAGLSGSEWWTLAGIWMRGAALAAFAAAVAGGIATITRNTAGAIGVAFAYGVILDPLLGVIRRGSFRPWLLQHNVPRLLGVGDVPQPEPRLSEGLGTTAPAMTLGVTRPLVLFACYAAVVLAVAYLAFRERDVT